MNAIMAISSTRFSTAKARVRKMWTLISGDSVRISTRTKMPMMAKPPMMQIHVPGLLHPHGTENCCRPKMLKPILLPAAMRTAPR